MDSKPFASLEDAGFSNVDTSKQVVHTTCPYCSHNRNKKHAKCLTLWPKGNDNCKANWHCNHCGWQGFVPLGKFNNHKGMLVQKAGNVYKMHPDQQRESDIFPLCIVKQTQQLFDRNNLIRYLAKLTHWDFAIEHANAWRIGTAKGGGTLFWHTSNGLLIRYEACKKVFFDETTAKTLTNEYGNRLFRYEKFRPDRYYKVPLYGAWQLYKNRDVPVMLVESEKSAFLGSVLRDVHERCIVLATGGTNGLTAEKAKALKGREVWILTDADSAGWKAAEKWADTLHEVGVTKVIDLEPDDVFSDYVSNVGPLPDGFDLADYFHWRYKYCDANGNLLPAHIVEFYS